MLRRFNAWVDQQNTLVQATIWLTIIFVIRTFIFGLYVVPSPSMETTMLVGERFLADKATPWITGIHRNDIISFNAPDYPYSDDTFANWWQRYVGISPWEWGPSNWTKRVIGIPGDRIQGTIENGTPVVYRNGEKLDEPYVNSYPLVTIWSSDAMQASWSLSPQQAIEHRSFDPNKDWRNQLLYQIDPKRIVRLPDIRTYLYPGQPSQHVQEEFDVTLGGDEYWVMGDNRLASNDSRVWGPLKEHLIHGKIRFCLFSVDSDYSWIITHLALRPIDFLYKVRWSRTLRPVT